MKGNSALKKHILSLLPIFFLILSINTYAFDQEDIPAYENLPYSEINGNVPFFDESDLTTSSYETYLPFDDLGRCQAASACLGPETLSTEKRGAIGRIKPSGWHTVKYPDQIEDLYLYNRCHLIAYELSAENDNEYNLVTGTRYMNVSGMLPFENKTTDYIKTTGNHVLYRSTPVFKDNELVCRGVLIEALSVEDHGDGIRFCIFCHNVQPGIEIDYATGDSHATENTASVTDSKPNVSDLYVINKRSGVFHHPDCDSVNNMAKRNKETTGKTREQLLSEGYRPCQNCNP